MASSSPLVRPNTATTSPRSVATRRSVQPFRRMSRRQSMRLAHRSEVARNTRSSATFSQESGYGRASSSERGGGGVGGTASRGVRGRDLLRKKGREWWSRKPSSVRPRRAGRSSLLGGGRPPPHAAYPRLERSGPDLAAYLALLRLGVALPRLFPAARWALTPPFHPCPRD